MLGTEYLCPPPNSYVEALRGWYLEVESLEGKNLMKVEGHGEISALRRRVKEPACPLCSLPCEDTARRQSSAHQEAGPPQNPDLRLPSRQMFGPNVCCPSPQAMVFLLCSPSWLRQSLPKCTVLAQTVPRTGV